jgi:hypothetical protein
VITLFDYLTVCCFLCVAIAFFLLTDRELRTLWRLMASCLMFAIANQAGNAGWTLLGAVLVVLGLGYAIFVVKGAHRST